VPIEVPPYFWTINAIAVVRRSKKKRFYPIVPGHEQPGSGTRAGAGLIPTY